MVDSPRRLLSSAYEIQRDQGLGQLARQSIRYVNRNTVLRARASNKDSLRVECDGIEVEFDTTSRIAKDWFYPRYLDGGLHEPEITREVLASLEPDSTFYDVGALVGYYTAFASEACTAGEVHAFELDRRFLEVIRSTVERSEARVRLNHRAISDTTGDLLGYSGDVGVTSVDRSADAGEADRVETTTLDEYTRTNPFPDVMKVDVEGFEHRALEGARGVLERGHPKKLFLEVHPPAMREYGGDVHEVLSLLESYGYGWDLIEGHRDENSERRDVEPGDLEDVDNAMLVVER